MKNMDAKQEVPRRIKNTSRKENFIPDYDYLFDEFQDRKGKKKNKVFRKLIKMNLWTLIFTTILYVIQASPTWITPIATSNIITTATKAVSEGVTKEVWSVLIINAVIIFVLLLQNVPTTIWRWKLVSKMLRTTSAGIKSSVIRKLQSLSITYHKDLETGRVQSKFLKDTESIDALFNLALFSFIPSVLGLLISVGISVYKNGLVSLFFLLIIPVNVMVTFAFRKKIGRGYHEYRINSEKMGSRVTTMLEMIPVTKAHGLEKIEIASVNKTIDSLKESGLKIDKTIARFGSWNWVINTILSSTCLIFCAVLAILGKIDVGDIVLFQSMFGSISGNVSALLGMMPQISSGFEALSSVSEIMNAKDVECNIGKADISDIDGDIEFKDVSYRYPGTSEYTIKNLNLSVKKGECIAFVGASGSGKSTIMNLIIGFLVPEKGEVCIDGKPLTSYNLSEYRHHISVVPQNSILFSGTIRENITYGLGKYTEEEFMAACEKANLFEFVNELPNGLNTVIGEHGDKLSGGQKQRITIARALIRNPRIIILDEATSALDNISEYHVQKAISTSIQGRTTFIVAHRLSTIRNADRIVVMENGEAVEIGSYEELMEKKGKFYKLKCLNEMNLKNAEEGLS